METSSSVTTFTNSSGISKMSMAHIAGEIILIGGVSYLFHRRINDLNSKINELEKKIESLEEKKETDGDESSSSVTNEKFETLNKQVGHHINNIYSMIRQLAKSPHSPPPSPMYQSETDEREYKMKKTADNQKNDSLEKKQNSTSSNIASQQHVNKVKNVDKVLSFSLASISTVPVRKSKVEIVEDSDEEDSKENVVDETVLDDELEDELKELENEEVSRTFQYNSNSLETDDNRILNSIKNNDIDNKEEFSESTSTKDETTSQSSSLEFLGIVPPVKQKKKLKNNK